MAGKKYKKADEVRIEGNKIFSPVRQKWLTLTPEEEVRQQYLTVLIDEYSYSLDQIDEKVNVTGRGSAQARADFIIWRTAKDKADQKAPFIIIECKADNVTIKAADYAQGENHARIADASDKEIKELLSKLRVFKEKEFADLLHQCHNVIRNREKKDPAAAFDEIAKILFVKVWVERELNKKRKPKNLFSVDYLEEQLGDNPLDWLFQQTKQAYSQDQRVVAETDEPPGSVIGVQDGEGTPVSIRRRYSSKTTRIQTIRMARQDLDRIKEDKLIRRIDGNHRLAMAEQLQDDPTVPTKYIAPFCLILFGDAQNEADDYAESLIFHTINNTALPLESEHGLRLLLGQDSAYDMTPENEFNYSPELYLTRLLSTKLQGLTQPARERFGERPLTVLWEAARNLIAVDETIVESRGELEAFADDLFAGLSDILVRLTVNHPSLCKTHSFLELASRIWRETTGAHEDRVTLTFQTLDRIGRWLGSEGITGLLNPVSPAQQLLTTFRATQNRIPRKVFLARWYPPADAPNGAFNKANLRLEQLRQTLDNFRRTYGISLELIDMGTEEGGTFPIHQKMYEAIAGSEIIICDLTGHRPNVYVEAGYALKHHEQNRLIYLFEPQDSGDRVPFDLNTFKYVQISQAAEIQGRLTGRLTPEIKAILEDAGAVLERERERPHDSI